MLGYYDLHRAYFFYEANRLAEAEAALENGIKAVDILGETYTLLLAYQLMFFIRLYRGAEENRIFHPISEIEKLSVYCSQARALAGALKIRYRVCRFEEDVLGLRQAFSMAKQYDLEFSELEHMADAGACDEYAAGLIKQIRSEWETETLPGSDLGGGPWEKNLSRQERAVLNLIAGGLSNQQIAEKLCIAVATVKTHNYNIFKKLGVSNRMAASQKARHLGLI